VGFEIREELPVLAGGEEPSEKELHARMKRIRFRGNDIPENWAAAVADHNDMVAALERRDGKTLGAVLQRHLDASWDRLAASLRIDPAVVQPASEP
jgi:DNA-binding GntR family transcriptional regulator